MGEKSQYDDCVTVTGVVGVSEGVMSVISDYSHPHLPLLTGDLPEIKNDKFLKGRKASHQKYNS